MNNIAFTGIAAFAAITLSACGGGGGADDTVDPREGEVATGITSAAAIAKFDELNTGFVNIREQTGLRTDLPSTGSAEYNGSLGFDASGALPGGGTDVDASFVGDLNLEVDFTVVPTGNGELPNSIEGSVRNIIYADTDGNFDDVAGVLNIDGGVVTLPRNNLAPLTGVLSADAVGTIVIDQPDGAKTVDMFLDMSGQFAGGAAGSAPEAVQGFVVGDVSNNGDGGTGDLTLNIPNGRFAAETAGAGILP